jgi:hypothetical protein
MEGRMIRQEMKLLNQTVGSFSENHRDKAKSQPISIANECGRSIIDREKSKPVFSI